MTTKAPSASINYATDTYKTALQLVENEFVLLYNEVNQLYKLGYTTNGSPYSGAGTGDVWLDGSGASPVLKYYDGANWNQLSTSLFTTTLDLDNGFAGYSKNMILETVAGSPITDVAVNGSAESPATISVYLSPTSHLLLQATSAKSVTISGAAGLYDIWAQHTGGTGSTFNLAFVAKDGTPTFSYGQRKIGRVRWSGTAIVNVISDERPYQETSLVFSAWTGTSMSNLAEGYNTVVFDTEDFDLNGAYDAGTGVFTAPVTGWYEFGVNMEASSATTNPVTNRYTLFFITHNLARYTLFSDDTTASGTVYYSFRETQPPIYLTAGDTIKIESNHTQASATMTLTIIGQASNAKYDCCFWGKYIGA